MIVGHYAASFVGKAIAPRMPLWQLVLAAQLIDFVWAILVLVGLEHAALVPGYTRAFPFDFYDMPYSHSLVMLVVWTVLSYAAYWVFTRRSILAMVFAGVVASHWVLDLFVHKADLPLGLDQNVKVGFDLWDWPLAEFATELALVLVGFAIYARVLKLTWNNVRRVDVLVLASMLVIHVAFYFGLYPRSMPVVTWLVLIGYAVVVWLAFRFEQHPKVSAA